MNESKFKIFARRGNDRCYLEIDVPKDTDPTSMLAETKCGFSPEWDIWLERFPTVHPYAPLERRLHYCENSEHSVGRPRGQQNTLQSIKIKPEERQMIDDAISRSGPTQSICS